MQFEKISPLNENHAEYVINRNAIINISSCRYRIGRKRKVSRFHFKRWDHFGSRLVGRIKRFKRARIQNKLNIRRRGGATELSFFDRGRVDTRHWPNWDESRTRLYNAFRFALRPKDSFPLGSFTSIFIPRNLSATLQSHIIVISLSQARHNELSNEIIDENISFA